MLKAFHGKQYSPCSGRDDLERRVPLNQEPLSALVHSPSAAIVWKPPADRCVTGASMACTREGTAQDARMGGEEEEKGGRGE